MAIGIRKYVDISSSVASDALNQRALDGLLFCVDEMLEAATDKAAYDGGAPLAYTLSDIKSAFGASSDVYKYASKYFGYSSPNGTYPGSLTVAKMVNSETPAEAIARVDGLTNNFGVFAFQGITVESAPSSWATATSYSVFDVVVYNGSPYICTTAHTSSSSFDATKFENAKAYYLASAMKAAAETNAAFGFKYRMVVNTIPPDTADVQTAIGAIEGLSYIQGSDHYGSYMLLSPAATVDYDRENSTQVFMYKTFNGEAPTVMSDSAAGTLDGKYVNYYGRTQTNGKTIDFLQRGFMSDGLDIGCYDNEVWLKARIATEVMNLFLSVIKIPANEVGGAMIRNVVAPIATLAIRNGTISVGKTLSPAQKQQAVLLTGDSDAPTAIEQNGYWLGIVIVQSGGEYIAKYRLVYAKGDAIRKVEGINNLI